LALSSLHQLEGGRKEDPVASFDEGIANGAEQMGFTTTRQAKGEDILGPFDEVPLAEGGELSAYRLGQAG
jgi:hypothetical protein